MAEIKSMQAIREKYGRVTPQRSQDYERGVKAPRRDWSGATLSATQAYTEGVQAAIQRGAFAEGVRAAGSEKWQGRAATVGVQRWGPGVRAGVSAYEEGFAPYRQVIESTALPEKFPRGDPRNYERVKAIGEALRRKATEG